MAKWNMVPGADSRIRASVAYDSGLYDVSKHVDHETMQTHATAQLEGLIAEKLVDKMLDRFARRAKVSPEIMMELITYMVNDDEFMKRFIANRAAKRIICGPLMDEDMKR